MDMSMYKSKFQWSKLARIRCVSPIKTRIYPESESARALRRHTENAVLTFSGLSCEPQWGNCCWYSGPHRICIKWHRNTYWSCAVWATIQNHFQWTYVCLVCFYGETPSGPLTTCVDTHWRLTCALKLVGAERSYDTDICIY